MTQPTHADITNRLDKGNEKFVEIEKCLRDISAKLEPLDQMQQDIAATKEIVEAWGAVKTMGKFLKWLAGIVGAVTAIVVAIKVGAASFVR